MDNKILITIILKLLQPLQQMLIELILGRLKVLVKIVFKECSRKIKESSNKWEQQVVDHNLETKRGLLIVLKETMIHLRVMINRLNSSI